MAVKPANPFNAYDWVDAWARAWAGASQPLSLMSTVLDDRVFAPPEALTSLAPRLLQLRRTQSAMFKLLSRVTAAHEKPAFGITSVKTARGEEPVRETVLETAPFCRLLKFDLPERKEPTPSILLVAPMAGHYATLLRETVRDLLPHYTVHITDWANARDVPLSEGGFDLDDYIDQLTAYFRRLGPEVHVLAICQAGVPATAAVALLEAGADPDAPPPRSLTIMGAPIDTGRSPTDVNELASARSEDWFSDTLISMVPGRYPGAHRPVYPGFLQLTAFLAMNPERHQKSARDAVRHFAEGEFESAEKIDSFYGEFLSVMDLTAEFYLQTVVKVFRNNELANGRFSARGRRVDLGAIEATPLMAVEGERDDITGLGQTRAALDLAVRLSPERKRLLVLEGAGHYGLFSGRRFRETVLPALAAFHAAPPTARRRS